MATIYSELFRIQCRHGYFADGVCPPLTLTPTPQCAAMLYRYDCLFRSEVGGGRVYYGANDGASLMSRFDEVTALAFILTDAGHKLASITEIPFPQTVPSDESVYYFNNLQANPVSGDGGQTMLLHPAGKALAAGPLAVRPAQFVYAFASAVKNAKVQLFDWLNREAWSSQTPVEPTPSINLNLSNLPFGRYRMQVNGSDVFSFYLSGVTAAKRWGMVEIFPGGAALAQIVPKGCRSLDKNGTIQPPITFAITLEPRQSFWRYYIVSQSSADRTYGDFQIVGGAARAGKSNGSAPITFIKPTQQRVNGRDAWVFESKAPIAIYEFPQDQYEFNLNSNGRNGGGGAASALPYGRTDTTRLERGPDGKPRMCSEIFVYL